MNKTLKTRTQKLVAAIPEKDLYDFTIIIYDQIQERNKSIITNFNTGDEVTFMKGKVKFNGTITKLRKTDARVTTEDNLNYDVPAYLLRKAQYIK